MEHPAKCEKCGQLWDFGTDGIGRLIALHPIGKCVPPVAPEYETDEEDEETLIQLSCIECGERFFRGKHKGAQEICSDQCRLVRKTRKLRESYVKRGKWWRTAA